MMSGFFLGITLTSTEASPTSAGLSRSDLMIRRALSLTAIVSMTAAALYLVFTDCKSCRFAAQSAGLDAVPLAPIGLIFALLSLSIVVYPTLFNTRACREWLAGSSLLVAAGCAVLTLLQVSLEQYCIPCLIFSAGCAVLATVSLVPALHGKSPAQRGRALSLVLCLALGAGAATALAKTGYGLGSYARYLRARAFFAPYSEGFVVSIPSYQRGSDPKPGTSLNGFAQLKTLAGAALPSDKPILLAYLGDCTSCVRGVIRSSEDTPAFKSTPHCWLLKGSVSEARRILAPWLDKVVICNSTIPEQLNLWEGRFFVLRGGARLASIYAPSPDQKFFMLAREARKAYITQLEVRK